MKNHACFSAMTFAFTVAGSAIGYGLRESPEIVVVVTLIVSVVGGVASLFCASKDVA